MWWDVGKRSCPIPSPGLLLLCHSHSPPAGPLHNFVSFRQRQRTSMPFCPTSLRALQGPKAEQSCQQHECHSCQTCCSSCPLMNQQPLQLCLLSMFLQVRPDVSPQVWSWCLLVRLGWAEGQACAPRWITQLVGQVTFRFSHIPP